MQFLKANTQIIVTVGPFVDVGDGFTPQIDITLSGNEAELIKHGSTAVVDISAATWAAVTSCRGYYSLTLTTSHTDTEGLLIVIVQDDSDCLPVKQEYMVLNEAAWDSMFAIKDSGFMNCNIAEISNDQTAAGNLELALENGTAGYIASDLKYLDGTAQRAADLAEIAQYLIANSAEPLTDYVANDSLWAKLLAVDGTAGDYNDNNHSLEALRARGDAAWATATSVTVSDKTGFSLANGSIVAATFAANAITSTVVADNTITAAKLNADCITAAKIADDAIGDDQWNVTRVTANSDQIEGGDATDAINAACDASLDTAISELGVAAPTATPTVRTGLMLLYMALRNQFITQTSGTDAIEIYNDADTLIAKKLITDDTSDYTEAKMTSG